MAVSDQPLTQFSDTTAHKRAISDYISMISPTKTPMVAFYGLEGDPGKFQIVNWPSAKVEWLSTTLATRADTLNGSITSTVLTITVTDGSMPSPSVMSRMSCPLCDVRSSPAQRASSKNLRTSK